MTAAFRTASVSLTLVMLRVERVVRNLNSPERVLSMARVNSAITSAGTSNPI
jgi:hypothetical protein